MRLRRCLWVDLLATLTSGLALALAVSCGGGWLAAAVTPPPEPAWTRHWLEFTTDRQPVVTVASAATAGQPAVIQDLAGQVIEPRPALLAGFALGAPHRPHQPPPRRTQVLRYGHGEADADRLWLGVRPRSHPRRAYLMRCDAQTGVPVGYLTPSGFADALPPPSGWFDLSPRCGRFDWCHSQVVAVRRQGGLRYFSEHLIRAGDQLWRADLGQRRFGLVGCFPGLVSAVVRAQTAPAAAEPGPSPVGEVIARGSDRIWLVSPTGQVQRTIPVPEQLRDQYLVVYLFTPACAVSSDADDHRTAWRLNDDGTATKLAELPPDALGPRPDHDRWRGALAGTAVGPLALAWFRAFADGGLVSARWPDVAQRLRRWWLPLVSGLVLQAAAGWLTWRRQRRYHAPHTGWQVGLALLAGLPGWLAYRWLRAWPALEACPRCRQLVPVDRPGCAACDAAWTPNAPTTRPAMWLVEP